MKALFVKDAEQNSFGRRRADMMNHLTPDEQKALMKEALQEWLDKKLQDVGWWTVKGAGAVILFAVVTYAIAHGFRWEQALGR